MYIKSIFVDNLLQFFMSYLVLARKWRPKFFSEVSGQNHVVKALQNSLKQNKVHHAFLFAGTRGVGKTTIARLLAKALNCEQGVVYEPCGQCESCCLLYTSPSPRDLSTSRMPSSA